MKIFICDNSPSLFTNSVEMTRKWTFNEQKVNRKMNTFLEDLPKMCSLRWRLNFRSLNLDICFIKVVTQKENPRYVGVANNCWMGTKWKEGKKNFFWECYRIEWIQESSRISLYHKGLSNFRCSYFVHLHSFLLVEAICALLR